MIVERETYVVVGSCSRTGQELVDLVHEHGDPIVAITGDAAMADRKAVFERIRDVRPRYVINALPAALMTMNVSLAEAADALERASAGVAMAATATGAFLVHHSSSFVFDARDDFVYREEHAPNAADPAGQALRRAEQASSEHAQAAFVRSGFCFSSFIVDLIDHLQGESAVTVPTSNRIQPTCCRDVAAFILRIAMNEEPGVFHFVNSGDTSWYQFVNALREELRAECRVLPTSTPDEVIETTFPACPVLASASARFSDYPTHWRDAVRRCVRHATRALDDQAAPA